MDFIETLFTKHYSNYGIGKVEKGTATTKPLMDLQDFRSAVKDIEADHLRRVCETE